MRQTAWNEPKRSDGLTRPALFFSTVFEEIRDRRIIVLSRGEHVRSGRVDVDLLLRGGAVSLLALLASQFWRAGGTSRLLAISGACGCAYLVTSSPTLSRALGEARWLVSALASTGPFWFLIATRRAFGARAALKTGALVSIAACLALLTAAPTFTSGGMRFALSLTTDIALLLLFVASLYSAWRGLADDLDPQRRSVRLALLGVSAGLGLVIATGAFLANASNASSASRTHLSELGSGGVLAVTWAFCFLAMRLAPQADVEKIAAPANDRLTKRIVAAFEVDKLHRRPDLTLSVLARELATAEHQVRKSINTDLRCRNFSAFVNGYRVSEVKQALADPAQVEVPIATIALDAGFGSIATFNRVFKDVVGVSPSEFRHSAAEN